MTPSTDSVRDPAGLLVALQRSGALRTLDHALAQSLRRLDPDTPDPVLAAAALASLAVANGHAGFDPARPRLLVDADLDWPEPAAWRALLRDTRWVDRPGDPLAPSATGTPLVLEPDDAGGLLYLRRYREYEAGLAAGLRRIAAHPLDAAGPEAVADIFATLFPDAQTGDDRQARAAALALRRALLLVTGGPGTGKTTTIARLLVLRIAQALRGDRPPPRIALAAPTGRAAERMAESLRRAVQGLTDSLDPALHAALPGALPDTACTLHRLLGTIPDSPAFRHNAAHPLPLDVLVVDEASMVDLPLMAKLVDAVADGAQLILLGDADQLPSVEAGDVLAAILVAAGAGHALQADDARALQPLLGVAPVDADTRGLRGHRVQLLRGYRQDAGFDLAPLAEAARDGDADTALALLRGGQLRGVHFHEDVPDPLEARHDALLAHWRSLADAPDPATALARAQRLRLLTAVREGPQGARGLNARIEALLSGRRTGPTPAWFDGRLLLVTENSYRHRLFNGDIGICRLDADGVPMAWFAGDAPGEVRAFHPAALPAHESAFAMTVHKAQGSEFDEVWLQLPRHDSRVLSRELVYTALTRARSRLHVAGSAQVLRDALARYAVRMSGLAWRLGAANTQAGPAATQDPGRDPDAPPCQGALF
ncbi:exodeoxyribonuclease V subunit alpha [Luteimonas sp. FCS-9]|uniref:exodeoxyribonuclease V subunit alpha n=1 Tax=Luteimonas sp. FCS-9 TaxID=1547516 RepID=UPI00063EAE52|nr:exodeoxyribonuclease V subunit alpha [Luteimonas sp. FCS-9]KLI99244.1 exodeoxyribonuclease V subunit alpha [Luteimonas sp. FCS-9]